MTLANLVEQKVLLEELSGDTSAKDRYLQRVFGLSETDLEAIRQIRADNTLVQKCFKAGEILKAQLLKRTQEEQLTVSSQFTLTTLAGLIHDDWNNPDVQCNLLGQAFRRHYKKERTELEQKIGMRVPSSHLFRDELGVYEGNLIEAKERRPAIDASSSDWLDSVRIPLEVDSRLMFFLGLVWADGRDSPKIRGKSHIHLNGRGGDYQLYEGIIQPLIHDLFNKRTSVSVPEGLEYPVLVLGSKVVTGFIEDCFGFPKRKKYYAVPDFGNLSISDRTSAQEDLHLKRSFLTGLMAGMAVPYTRGGGEFWVRLFDRDTNFIKSIHQLMQGLGLNSNYSEDYDSRHNKTVGRIYFYGKDARQLYFDGLMMNPKHYDYATITKLIE